MQLSAHHVKLCVISKKERIKVAFGFREQTKNPDERIADAAASGEQQPVPECVTAPQKVTNCGADRTFSTI